MRKTLFFLITITSFIACNNSNGWTAAQKNDFINSCSQSAAANIGQEKAKAYCTCMQQKLEAKYPNYQEANKNINAPGAMQTAEMQAMVNGCLNGGNVNNNNNNNNTNNPVGTVGGNNNNNNNNMGGGWSDADKQKFMNTCVQNARNAGGDEQTSRAHCECTLGKIEKRFNSWDEANQKMTAAEVTALEQECNQEQNGNNNQQ